MVADPIFLPLANKQPPHPSLPSESFNTLTLKRMTKSFLYVDLKDMREKIEPFNTLLLSLSPSPLFIVSSICQSTKAAANDYICGPGLCDLIALVSATCIVQLHKLDLQKEFERHFLRFFLLGLQGLCMLYC